MSQMQTFLRLTDSTLRTVYADSGGKANELPTFSRLFPGRACHNHHAVFLDLVELKGRLQQPPLPAPQLAFPSLEFRLALYHALLIQVRPLVFSCRDPFPAKQ
jgi:hypothetical protein